MSKKIFVNIAVKDLKKTINFFTELGFSFNMHFTDEKAASMIINDDAFVMFLQEEFFKTFTPKELVDAGKNTEVITALSAESKEEVNKILEKALSMGATETRESQENEFMFGRSFNDLDGHIWEVIWMDMAAFEKESK